MNLGELIALTRARLDDNALQSDGSPVGNLWSNAELRFFLNDAVREACERGKLIRDEVTDNVTLITIIAGQSLYALHASVFEIDGIRYTDSDQELCPTSSYEMSGGIVPAPDGYAASAYGSYPQWRSVRQSRARYFIQESLPDESIRLRLVPVPMEAAHVDRTGTTVPTQIRLTVYRTPLAEMVADGDVPSINVKHHFNLIDWACKRAFERRDRDTYDPTKSADAEAEFARSFGIKETADQKRMKRERRRETVRYMEF